MRKLLQQQGMSEKLQIANPDDMAMELKQEAEQAVTGIEMRNAMIKSHDFLQKYSVLLDDENSYLTEPGGDGEMPMTTKTRLQLLALLAKTVSSIASSKWKIDSSSMIHSDEVKKRIWDTYRMTLKHVEAGQLTTKEQFNDGWFRELQAIWSSKGI